jgi:hypothetical protein
MGWQMPRLWLPACSSSLVSEQFRIELKIRTRFRGAVDCEIFLWEKSREKGDPNAGYGTR